MIMRIRKLWLRTLMPALACCALAAGQKLPVPFWPKDGRIPSDLKDQYVFLTQDRSAVIVLAPGGPGDTEKRPVRIELHNRIVPTVRASVREDPPGTYLYRYAISNAVAARDSIGAWSLVLPANAVRVKMRPVAGEEQDNWSGGDGGPAIVPAANGGTTVIAAAEQFELRDAPRGRYVSWFKQPDGRAVVPGASRDGFSIESRDRPGFTTVVFYSGHVLGDAIDQDWPPDILDQLSFLNDLRWTQVAVLTIGPMFPGTASLQETVTNFRTGIERLIEVGRLDSQSPFIKEVIESLGSIAEQRGQPTSVLSLKGSPSTEAETEVMSALAATLGLVSASKETGTRPCAEKESLQ